jgi:hypothetical protein
MKPYVLLLAACFGAQAHDIITTSVTWNRDISRIVQHRCVSCHRPDGMAFSLTTYAEARPWAVAIKEEVLSRRMPPWGAVKGFGEFRNEEAASPEEMERIVSWVDGGVPEGDEKDLPPPAPSRDRPAYTHSRDEQIVSGEFVLSRPFRLDGLWPESVPENGSIRITAEFPGGAVEQLLWLFNYKVKFGHPFLLVKPLSLPAHTVIRGIPPSAKIALLPAGRQQ